MELTQSPRKAPAAQELEAAAQESMHGPVPADVARKLSVSFANTTLSQKPPLSPRVEIVMEQEH
jgi:hypothetical protein